MSRVETQVASSYQEAAETYHDDPVALQLRAMNMVSEGIRTKDGLVLVPSDAIRGMNLDTVLGAKAETAGSDVQE